MKKTRVAAISVHQTAKVIAVLTAVLFAILQIPMGIFHIFLGDTYFGIAMMLIPILYFILFYIFHAIGFWFYNLVTEWVGGIEVVLENVDEPNVVE